MPITNELVNLQRAWIDTSKRPHATRRKRIEPLVLSLDHIKACQLPREEAIPALCGTLLKLWERFEQPVTTCSTEEVFSRIHTYVEKIYQYFDEAWTGSLAHLTHQRESLEDGCHFLILEQSGEVRS